MTKEEIKKATLASPYRVSREVLAIELQPGIGLPKEDASALLSYKTASALHFFNGLKLMKKGLKQIKYDLFHWLPTRVTGTLLQPDGTPARDIIIKVAPPDDLGDVIWGEPGAVTDIHGTFIIKLPSGIIMPSDNTLKFLFRGRNAEVLRGIKVGNSSPAFLNEIRLEVKLEPVPRSIIASLASVLGWISDITEETTQEPETKPPDMQVKLGEDKDSLIVFKSDMSRDLFRFNVLIRLVEPRLSILRRSWHTGGISTEMYVSIGKHEGDDVWFKSGSSGISPSFSDRIPIDRPLNIDDFRDDLIGDRGTGVIDDNRIVPMAATLGLGYVVKMAQHWMPSGLSLGNLVYSLPLAPGEQQRVAVFEQIQTASVFEKETLDVEEQQSFSQITDASTQAVFASSFDEASRGSSHYDSVSTSQGSGGAWGVGGGILAGVPGLGGFLGAGGGGSSSSGVSTSSGNSSQTLDGARNYVSSAAEDLHNSVQRQASARRRVQRTGMRLATASDRETAVTKVITNNNRMHALTIQYWEVLRNFEVTTSVDGVTLVCFVPLEVIRFLPDGQPIMLGDAQISKREDIIKRYSQIAKHADILHRRVPADLRYGIDLLMEFISNPEAEFAKQDDLAENTVEVSVTARLLPHETIYAAITTKNSGRFGPIPLAGYVKELPDRFTDASHAYATTSELFKALQENYRDNLNPVPVRAAFALPDWFALHEITGIELTRSFNSFTYQLNPKDGDPAKEIVKQLATAEGMEALSKSGGIPAYLQMEVDAILNGVRLDPNRLESEFGGPTVLQVEMMLKTKPEVAPFHLINESSAFYLPSTPYPMAALRQVPVLKYSDLLKIEKLLQHVVHDPVTYSKFVWQSLTAEERAIMLEGYTIGVPSDGIPDESQNIPLLNCVANQVLGFYGNAMVMPFNIPPDLAGMLTDDSDKEEKAPFTTGVIQNALTEFHRKAFSPPISHITLPTRGVLGEAVLGTSPSAEKIDLTRFWNWQDSPIAQASDIGTIDLNRGSSLVSGMEGPKALTGLSPMIANINATPASEGGELVKALIAGANTKDLPDITGSKELVDLVGKTLSTAEAARADALAKASSMASEALKAAPDVLKATAEGKAAQDKAAAESKATKETKDASDKKEKENAEQETRKQNFLSLKQNANGYLEQAEALFPDEAMAKKFAEKIIGSATAGMPPSWLASLLPSFKNDKWPNGTKVFQNAILNAMLIN